MPGRGVGDREAVVERRVRDEHARIQAGEDRRDEADRAQARRREGPAARGRARVSTAARISAIAVSAAGTAVGRMPRLLRSWATATVQATIAMPRSAAGTDSRLAIAAARSQKSPDSRSVRYVAPWAAKMATTASPASDGVGAEQVEEVAGEDVRGVQRHAVDEVGQRDSPDERGADASDRVRPQPGGPPARAVVLLAPLERDHADDQQHEDQQQRDVEAGEHRRVPGREGGEGRAGGDHQPHLVAVPHRSDRLEHQAALALVAGEDREQHPDAEVEPLEQEVAAPEDARSGRTRTPRAPCQPAPVAGADSRAPAGRPARRRRRSAAGPRARSGASGRSRRSRA